MNRTNLNTLAGVGLFYALRFFRIWQERSVKQFKYFIYSCLSY